MNDEVSRLYGRNMTADFGKKALVMTFYTIIPSSGIRQCKLADVLCLYG
jgi:hypothetical protein